MRLPNAAAWLALPAFLTSSALAIPNHAAYFQRPLSPAKPPPSSPWKLFSDAVIDSIWKPHRGKSDQSARHPPNADLKPPPHTLAQYGGDVVLRFNLTTTEEAESLADAADILMLDVWEFSANWVDIRLSKDVVPSLLGLLPETLQHSHTPLLREQALAQAVWDTYPKSRHGEQQNEALDQHVHPFSPALEPVQNDETNIFFNDYQPLSVIGPWMKLLASLFTTHVRLVNIGYSHEGREIPAFRLGVHPTNNEQPNPSPRKTILITGGAHAREWISTSTVNYIAYSLITGYGKNPTITHLLQTLDIVLIPTLNPDGYTYTWQTDRLWRKNRQQTPIRFCPGLDLDRSYSTHWSSNTAHPSANNPCSESYAGAAPFQAIESLALATWAQNLTSSPNTTLAAFLDFHSYSQQILYPYSYSCQSYPPNLENLEELAMGLAKSIRTAGKGYSYSVLPACEGNTVATASSPDVTKPLLPRMESNGGSALDYFYQELKVRFAYQVKLRDKGSYGFLLPREHIVPTGKEMLEAVLFLAGRVVGEAGAASEDEVGNQAVVEGKAEKGPGGPSESLGEGSADIKEEEEEEEEEEDGSKEYLRRRRR